ncbi:MAG: sigma-54-dependent Fis family transcriptional regulator [Gemmatimonadales bacterium]|nr:sigma-54-dependent Fis family transcriptional regulator [Gemmatimonadales bacterium]
MDDEPAVGVMVEHAVNQMGHRCLLAAGVDEGMKLLERSPVDLIVADYQMPEKTGLELMTLLEQEGLRIPVIIMTGYSSIEHAVVSIRSGAIDYLTKPVRAESLRIAISQALEVLRLRRENETFRRELLHLRTSRVLIGESPAWRRVLETLDSVAPTKATVLLEGESGTGKELVARAIHERSPRHSAPFVTVNCAALPEGLVESALFGHERGAFTGATARTAGAFERAHGGTLLLDEISEMRLDLQSKLLRAIQEQEFERVGGSQSVRVDVRLLATTNLDLKSEMAAGRFRSDLYYRLNVVPIRTPALRERADDIPRLVHHFVQRAAASLGLPAPDFAPETLHLLQSYAWPGNVRELANAVERAIILSRGPVLMPEAFASHLEPLEPRSENGAPPIPIVSPDPELPLDLGELKRQAIARALAATGGNRTRAAKLLGISERTLRNRLKSERKLEGR